MFQIKFNDTLGFFSTLSKKAFVELHQPVTVLPGQGHTGSLPGKAGPRALQRVQTDKTAPGGPK